MVTNRPYLITRVKRTPTKFGNRIGTKLDRKVRLILPKRYNRLTDQQLIDIRTSSKIALVNREPRRQIHALELVDMDEGEQASTSKGVQPPPSSSKQRIHVFDDVIFIPRSFQTPLLLTPMISNN